ncbi:hypothetical protein CBR_g38608 [Chara braunii]|uniref:Uncharacterized protein n=1 Tax=Chara braunii TaxID=69332 RepID=A0A388K0E7_CHABU|nr:hypothetical protein CBR_g38608 [Chara braunii]|eukprot:GBG63540.1 hypothetical protein CBR_g38608 [Chara braunii]
MSGVDHGRDPCPDRILDDIGTAFSMGVLGGSAWHFLRGMKNSPRGERFGGGVSAVRMNAPRIGGSFANWGALFASFDCTLVYLRKKEDPWNAIAAGAAAGASLQLRQGLKSAGKAAVMGGAILALIEGTGILLNRLLSQLPPPEEQMGQQVPPAGVGMGAPMYSPGPALSGGAPIPGYAAAGVGGGGGGGIPATSGLPSMASASASAGTIGGNSNLYGASEIQLDGAGNSSSSSSSFPSSSASGASSSSSGSSKKSGSWLGGWLGGGSAGTKEGDAMVSGSGTSSSGDRGIGGFDVNSSPPIPHFGSGTDNYSFK